MPKIAAFATEHREQIKLVVNATVLVASTIVIAGIIKDAMDAASELSEAPGELAI